MEDAQRNLICHHTGLQPTPPASLPLPQVVPSPYIPVPLPLFPCPECLTSDPQFSAHSPASEVWLSVLSPGQPFWRPPRLCYPPPTLCQVQITTS